MESLCEYCKNPFESKRSDTMYCSQTCKQLAYVTRKAAGSFSTDTIPALSSQNNDLSTAVNGKENKIEQNVNTDNADVTSQNPLFVNTGVINDGYTSAFVQEINRIIKGKDNVEALTDFEMQLISSASWVNVRYKCLVECLLTFSEMPTISLDDLKEVCNAFTDIIQSNSFYNLPDYYPYEPDIRQLRESLKALCLNADEDQPFNFRLKKETKLKMLATRWELAHVSPKRSFNQLDFTE